MAKQSDRPGKDVQHMRFMKDENGNVMVSLKTLLKRWKEYFEKLMNEKNDREPRTKEAENSLKQLVFASVEKEVKNALRRMKKGWVR